MINIYNESCNTSNVIKNTGTSEECIESVMSSFMLHKDGTVFSIDKLKNLESLQTLISEGKLVPMFEVYELTSANTEASFFESGNYRAETKKATKSVTFEHYLSFHSHAAIKSYGDVGYDRIIQITEDGLIIAVKAINEDDTSGVIYCKGQRLTDFNVGIRMPATNEKPPYTPIQLTYDNYDELEDNAVVLVPDYNPNIDIEGIFDIGLTKTNYTGLIVGEVSRVLTVKAETLSGNINIKGILASDINVLYKTVNTQINRAPDSLVYDSINQTYAIEMNDFPPSTDRWTITTPSVLNLDGRLFSINQTIVTK